MSILSDLQTKRLGLFELMAMGYDLYLRHFQGFLALLCMLLPFSIIDQFLSLNRSSNSLLLITFWVFNTFCVFVVSPAYYMAFCILIEGYVLEENPQIDVVIRKILPQLITLVVLKVRYYVDFFLRLLLIFIPGIIYYINNGYYNIAFILRDQRGKAAFHYSQSLVKENWWKVFFLEMLCWVAFLGLKELTSTVVINIITNSPILVAILSGIFHILRSLVLVGVSISWVLLFLNLDFQKQ